MSVLNKETTRTPFTNELVKSPIHIPTHQGGASLPLNNMFKPDPWMANYMEDQDENKARGNVSRKKIEPDHLTATNISNNISIISSVTTDLSSIGQKSPNQSMDNILSNKIESPGQLVSNVSYVEKKASTKSLDIPTTTPSSNLSCSDLPGWIYFKNNCYFIPSSSNHSLNPLSWSDARIFCLKSGGDLASVLDKNEGDFIESKVSNVESKVEPIVV